MLNIDRGAARRYSVQRAADRAQRSVEIAKLALRRILLRFGGMPDLVRDSNLLRGEECDEEEKTPGSSERHVLTLREPRR